MSQHIQRIFHPCEAYDALDVASIMLSEVTNCGDVKFHSLCPDEAK